MRQGINGVLKPANTPAGNRQSSGRVTFGKPIKPTELHVSWTTEYKYSKLRIKAEEKAAIFNALKCAPQDLTVDAKFLNDGSATSGKVTIAASGYFSGLAEMARCLNVVPGDSVYIEVKMLNGKLRVSMARVGNGGHGDEEAEEVEVEEVVEVEEEEEKENGDEEEVVLMRGGAKRQRRVSLAPSPARNQSVVVYKGKKLDLDEVMKEVADLRVIAADWARHRMLTGGAKRANAPL